MGDSDLDDLLPLEPVWLNGLLAMASAGIATRQRRLHRITGRGRRVLRAEVRREEEVVSHARALGAVPEVDGVPR